MHRKVMIVCGKKAGIVPMTEKEKKKIELADAKKEK
jgi:hypothetical protein